MNKKAVTIVELLASIVIMTIVASLVAILLSTYRSVNQDITDESKANIESTLLFQSIRNDLNAFSPTDYEACAVDDCIVLVKTFEYIYLEEGITLSVYEPAETINFRVDNQAISFSDQTYNVDYFSIGQDTSLLYSITASNLVIELNLVLESTKNTYNFLMTYTYKIETTPAT